MKRRDILFNTNWDEFDMGTCKLYVDFFEQYITFIFFQNHKPKPQITDKMISALNQILELNQKEQSLSFQKFGDKEKYKVQEVHIDQENEKFEGVYSEVLLQADSNISTSLIIKDGKIIHLDNNHSYFNTLEVAQNNQET